MQQREGMIGGTQLVKNSREKLVGRDEIRKRQGRTLFMVLRWATT